MPYNIHISRDTALSPKLHPSTRINSVPGHHCYSRLNHTRGSSAVLANQPGHNDNLKAIFSLANSLQNHVLTKNRETSNNLC